MFVWEVRRGGAWVGTVKTERNDIAEAAALADGGFRKMYEPVEQVRCLGKEKEPTPEPEHIKLRYPTCSQCGGPMEEEPESVSLEYADATITIGSYCRVCFGKFLGALNKLVSPTSGWYWNISIGKMELLDTPEVEACRK